MIDGVSAVGAISGVKAFADLVTKIGPAVASAAGKSFDFVALKFESTFGPHLSATFERCTKIKTLLNKDEPVDLLSLYVSTYFKCSKKQYDDFSVIEEIRKRKRVIISGTGGGGKTIFMKYLWISLFENPRGRIPVFIELRRLNDVTSDDLLLYIYISIVEARAVVSRVMFDKMVARGLFAFMFDGFDELIVEKRRQIERQILALVTNSPDNIVIVSGRPDERFDAWQAFSNFVVQPLEKKQVVELISKMRYDDRDIKKKFIDRVKRDLYDKHKSFLSSPLLATMMLITFREFADIPEKVHLFYEQAFDALFSKHDATKEGFKRKLYTDIPSDEFKRCMAYFCLVSYYDEKFEFMDDDLRRYIKKGLGIDNIDIDVESFIKDLVESICLMQRDGLLLTFSHRTFQEFFAAYCLAHLSIKHVREIVVKLARRPTDGVIAMLFDMNQELVETQFVLPILTDMVKRLHKLPKKKRTVDKYLFIFREELSIHLDGKQIIHFGMMAKLSDDYVAKNVFKRLYPRSFSALRAGVKKFHEQDKVACQQYIERHGGSGKNGLIHVKISVPNASTKEANEDLRWLETTGYAAYCWAECDALIKLLKSINDRRARRGRTIDEIFGIN